MSGGCAEMPRLRTLAPDPRPLFHPRNPPTPTPPPGSPAPALHLHAPLSDHRRSDIAGHGNGFDFNFNERGGLGLQTVRDLHG
jgi:hypothetical protein